MPKNNRTKNLPETGSLDSNKLKIFLSYAQADRLEVTLREVCIHRPLRHLSISFDIEFVEFAERLTTQISQQIWQSESHDSDPDKECFGINLGVH